MFSVIFNEPIGHRFRADAGLMLSQRRRRGNYIERALVCRLCVRWDGCQNSRACWIARLCYNSNLFFNEYYYNYCLYNVTHMNSTHSVLIGVSRQFFTLYQTV